jgi:hypothetical protein
MTNPMTNPVAPVVTDEMLNAAEDAYDKVAYYDGVDHCYADPLRAAITAALEASGELERLRAANEKMKATMQEVRLIAVDAQLRATYQRTALERISAELRTALEGSTE